MNEFNAAWMVEEAAPSVFAHCGVAGVDLAEEVGVGADG